MHEASLMNGLVRKIQEIAAAEGAAQVTGVRVWCGALSHMSAAHFAEHFEHAAAGTVAQGAQLDVMVSDDVRHPNAHDIRLESLELDSR